MKLSTKQIAFVGLLSALASVLMFFPHIPILAAFPFLKADFSDVPALMAALTIHPLSGVLVELVKNAIHLPFSDTSFIGELSNFIVGSMFVLSAGFLSQKCFPKMLMRKKLLITLPLSVLVMDAAAALSNTFLIGPMYFGGLNEQVKNFVLYGAFPFNLIKGGLEAVAFYVLYRALVPTILKNQFEYR